MEKYLAKGLTQSQIVDEWEQASGNRVSRSAISLAMKRYGLTPSRPVERYLDMLPWHIAEEHLMHQDARMLRFEARRRRGKSLTDKEKHLLHEWKQALEVEEAVVHYERNTPEGFHWVYRKDSDDDIIRRPKERKRK